MKAKLLTLLNLDLFIKMNDDIDGLVHVNDLSWDGRVEEELKNLKRV